VVVQEVDRVSEVISKGPRKKAESTNRGADNSFGDERKDCRRSKVTSLLPVGSPISQPSMIHLVSDKESATRSGSDISTDKDDTELRLNGDEIREVNLEDEIKQLDEDRTLTNREKLIKWLKLNGYSCVRFQPTTTFNESGHTPEDGDKGTALIALPQYPEISVSLEK
jgi:hypothetical protein